MEAADPNAVLDASALEPLIANHRAFLTFVERRVGSRAVAEDIVQEAFVRGISRASQVRNRESLVQWFYRVLRNAVADHYRRCGRVDRKLQAFASELEASEAPAEIADLACRCVARLAITLKPEYAQALNRIELDGIAVQDFAEEVGITTNNAAVRVFRAREALRRQVERSCGTCAVHGCVDCTCSSPTPTECRR